MKPFFVLMLLSLSGIALANVTPLNPKVLKEKPKLVLTIVFDQLRADEILRQPEKFLPADRGNGKVGGFNFLINKSAYFPFAHYDILQNMTGPGHSMILSGTYPRLSGISLNNWYSTYANDGVYCAEDAKHKLLGNNLTAKAHVGSSPFNFTGSTLGDELKGARRSSRTVSIALKDRAAILMAGHRADGVFWFDKSFQWISSDYYFPKGELPAWVNKHNKERISPKDPFVWDAKMKEDPLIVGMPSPLPLLVKILGEKFPHKLPAQNSSDSLGTPLGNKLTGDFAEDAITAYGLGKGPTTDLLSVSFGSHDYVGHTFGPDSREMNEMLLADDEALSNLLNKVARAVPGGLANVLVVLTADHGVAPNPDWASKDKMPAGRIDEGKMLQTIESALSEKFGSAGSEKKWIAKHIDLNFYLNHAVVEERGKPMEEVSEYLKWILVSKVEGVAHAFSAYDVQISRLPSGFERKILKTYFAGRSGEVVGILKPYYIVSDQTSDHMTGYQYDSSVPLFLYGSKFKKGVYSSAADIVDIAPTLAFTLGILAPSSSEGRVLSEVLQ